MGSLLQFAVGLCLLALVSAQTNPVVETTLGAIKGSILKTEKGLDINAFRGIRYAEAPVGDKRFKPPVAVSKWSTELDATKDGFLCPQIGKDIELLSEDCLILNVYSRDLAGNKTVIVYIHGGANMRGGSHSVLEAGPEFLMDSDIVLVTLNYRLGALGFLSTRTKDAPGNYGYLDQILALKWVKEHISKFGGNPDSVTILGLSAGAMAVTLHMSSPLSSGLFHRAIAMSGSTTNTYEIDNLYWTTLLARQTSCPMYNPDDVLNCLRKVPWQTIINVCATWEPYNFINMKWNYEIDGEFLEKEPTTLFANGDFKKVPILTGITKDELTYMVYRQEGNTGLFNDISVNFDKYAPELFMYSPEDCTGKRDDTIKTFYLGNKTINDQNITNFGEIFTDSIISHGVHRLVDLAREHVDVYYYRFDYAGRYGLYSDAAGKPRGIGHADDIQYVFKSKWFDGQIGLTDPERFMVERIVGWFSTFARNGSPEDVNQVKWLPSNKTKVYTMYNDKDVKLGDEPFTERFELWDRLFPVGISGSSTIYATSVLTAFAVLIHVFTKFVF